MALAVIHKGFFHLKNYLFRRGIHRNSTFCIYYYQYSNIKFWKLYYLKSLEKKGENED